MALPPEQTLAPAFTSGDKNNYVVTSDAGSNRLCKGKCSSEAEFCGTRLSELTNPCPAGYQLPEESCDSGTQDAGIETVARMMR